MMPPKGWKKNSPIRVQQEEGSVMVASPVISQPIQVPQDFTIGKWYLFIGDDGIMFDDAGRILKWSVIKFEVIKVVAGIIAVRFEDGSFEAIINRKVGEFKELPLPKY